MLLLTLRGTPTIYYGDELGMIDAVIPYEQQQDPWGLNVPGLGRDGCRTPMQWDTTANAGFSPPAAATTWLPLSADWEDRNVARHLAVPDSMLNLYRSLLRYRKDSMPLQIGTYRQVDAPEGCLAFERAGGQDRLLVLLNFTNNELSVTTDDRGSVALSTYLDRSGEAVDSTVALRTHEGVIVEIN
jgi:alpha-glucosidase